MKTNTKKTLSARSSIVSWLNSQLVGPMGGENELLSDKPYKRYLTGILYPAAATQDEVDENTPDDADNAVSLSSEFKPSSLALSFAASGGARLKLVVTAAVYEKDLADKNNWRREPLTETVTFDCKSERQLEQKLFSGRGKLTLIKRPWKDGFIVTVALSNNVSSGSSLATQDCLFQTKIHIQTEEGCFTEYPGTDRFRFDAEQQELSLLYRNRVNWSVGHGCASTWDDTSGEAPAWIETASIPAKEVYGFSTDIDFSDVPELPIDILSIQKLANPDLCDNRELITRLRLFVKAYDSWIETVESCVVADNHKRPRERVIGRLKAASGRIQRGISALENCSIAMRCFRLANEVMLMQMIHSGEAFGGSVRQRNEKAFVRPKYFSDSYAAYQWRPFQLAFQLLVIESLLVGDGYETEESRNIVDLLWFPTGGGKTEAYLAIAAWEMLYRRLQFGEKGGGTSVIKRYTLRLLTSQQFQRASTLICALETMRKLFKDELGAEEFTLGLWVGQDSAPNRFSTGDDNNPGALEKYEQLRQEEKPENPYQLQRCPWCGTSILPSSMSRDSRSYGVRASASSFEFYCPSDKCDFHARLPIQVVDDALYEKPPTMLIGTVDKFARLTWLERTGAFFGSNKRLPPSLIIQDELHLISGPLGTIAGIYEAGIDTLIRQNGGKAKIIAATATIRAAEQQSRRLFGREVQIFPPPGLDESDSFFSKEDRSHPGRLYLGVMPSGHTGQTALVHTAAALLQAPIDTNQDSACLDSWWTLPIYHNSRRELGKTMTLARDDIPSRIEIIAADPRQARKCPTVEELSANIKGAQIPEVLDKLQLDVSKSGCVDVLPCTNMISVGVDISRLGVMLINGQPKTTAEYIQASSRVGRDRKRPPAIVVTIYSPSKPRDRSHYETFVGYHQALYRHVEPTSITPWAKPARERALHAALIALVRLSGYLPENKAAGHFDMDNAEFGKLYQVFVERIEAAASDLEQQDVKQILEHLDELVHSWHKRAKGGLINRFDAEKAGPQFRPLIKGFNGKHEKSVWPTLNSMRNVDSETQIAVKGEH